ncbi:DUF362 domain-containing protein [bacterium]|nr:DUF362 domain-containing protein [bacterium]
MSIENIADVYFYPFSDGMSASEKKEAFDYLIERAGLVKIIGKNDLTAIKIHFGEKKNSTHIPPFYVRPLSERIKQYGGKPFLTDTCVLYKSQRDNSVDHLMLAHEHGFTIEATGAPVIIADGLVGNLEREVKINSRIYEEVSIAASAREANAIVVMTHVTGHMAAGMGAAIKNIGMGFASRKGKLKQHSAMKPKIKHKFCTGCGVCVEWCPVDCITMSDGKATINREECIGCGECLAVCRFGAVRHDWAVEDKELQRRMAEHALGVVKGKEDKILFVSFLINITKDCDCMDFKQEPLIPDIGIIAGHDPVSVDLASLDLILEKTGKTLRYLTFPDIDPMEQINYGERIGLGKKQYNLVDLSK